MTLRGIDLVSYITEYTSASDQDTRISASYSSALFKSLTLLSRRRHLYDQPPTPLRTPTPEPKTLKDSERCWHRKSGVRHISGDQTSFFSVPQSCFAKVNSQKNPSTCSLY